MSAESPVQAATQVQDREEWIFRARMASAVERYDEASQWLRKVVLLNTEVSIQERNLIRQVYKSAYDTRRNSWNILANLEKEQEDGKKYKGRKKTMKRIRYYRVHLQKEMQRIAADAFELLDGYLLPNANSADTRVFFYMMYCPWKNLMEPKFQDFRFRARKGDYHRYCAELVTGETRREAAISAMVNYKAAHRMAEVDMPTTHPVRLAVCVNYAVLLWRIFRTVERAVRMAKNGYDDAISVLHIADEEHVDDAANLMSTLRALMTRWARKLPKGKKNIMASRLESAI